MTLRACVFGALSSLLAIGAATAADLPSVKAAPEYAPPPAYSWEGWHFGVVGGYGGGNFESSSSIWGLAPPVTLAGLNSVGTSGWLVGYSSGYTWQFANNLVLGYESEFSYADVRSGSNIFAGPNARLEWFGAERLRFGYAMGRLLPYFTGGLAYGNVRSNGVNFAGGYVFPTTGSAWQAGWAVGAGLEYALWGNVSVKAEYLFTHLQGPSGYGGGFPASFRTFTGRNFDTHLARVGVNVNFADISSALSLIGLRF